MATNKTQHAVVVGRTELSSHDLTVSYVSMTTEQTPSVQKDDVNDKQSEPNDDEDSGQLWDQHTGQRLWLTQSVYHLTFWILF